MPEAAANLPRFIAEIATAKRVAGSLYMQSGSDPRAAPAATMLSGLGSAKNHQSIMLSRTVDTLPDIGDPYRGYPQPHLGELGGVLSGFCLDAAATAALVGLETAGLPPLASAAREIVEQDRSLEGEILALFAGLCRTDPGLGRTLGTAMIAARDWIKVAFPRRERLIALSEVGLVAPTAARDHDGYLASLGDRMQAAFGVLGEL